jgi:hypothetical protein
MNYFVTQWERLPCSAEDDLAAPQAWSDLKPCLLQRKSGSKMGKGRTDRQVEALT